MSSMSSQPQFRYTQPPSKVLHLRNLPYECSEEELIELGKPFGRIVNTKCSVGANRNQAFVEFENLNQAIAMISYYASSPDPAQVRGKTVYLQYSNRQEITNSKTSADFVSNVLLVTVEGVVAGDVSIDVLHLFDTDPNGLADPMYWKHLRWKPTASGEAHVFSAFGFVHKIATFEKTVGFQALVQFSDLQTASSAKDSLDGRAIPSYLLQEHVGPCTLRITYSAHTDLNVKFQSHRSRDYTNPYLPVAPSAIAGSGQLTENSNGKISEPESNVLLVSIENMQYAVTIDVLHMVFSNFGTVQKIAIFEKKGFQALIQYPDVKTAVTAKEALEGHCIYDGGFCKLHLTYSRHTNLNVTINNDRGRDYTTPNTVVLDQRPSILGQHPVPVHGPNPLRQNASTSTGTPTPNWNAGVAPAAAPAQMPNQYFPPPPPPPPGSLPTGTTMHMVGHAIQQQRHDNPTSHIPAKATQYYPLQHHHAS